MGSRDIARKEKMARATAASLAGIEKKRLVLLRSGDVLKKTQVQVEVLRKMLEVGMQRLTGERETSAWKKLFSPDDRVAIKVNCLSGRLLSSHPELVRILVENLTMAGVQEKNIIVYDRSGGELERAGFRLNRGSLGYQCFGTDFPGVGYTSEPAILSTGSCLSRILSEFCTALINVPVLKDHDVVGVSISLKNHLGSVHNPNKFHPNRGDPFIADLNASPLIRDKTRLIICDGLRAVFEGGPAFNTHGAWDFGGIIMGFDPVALDSLCLSEMEKKRREVGLPAFKDDGRPPTYITTAADEEHRLGERDPSRVKVERIKI